MHLQYLSIRLKFPIPMFEQLCCKLKLEQYAADIEICAFSKNEQFLMTASNQSGGGSLICCWDIKHSEVGISVVILEVCMLSSQFCHSV